MRRYFSVEVERGYNGKAGAEQVGSVKSTDIRNISSCQHAYTYSYIPGCQISGSGRPPLAVWGEVDEQCVVCREHDAESHSEQQGDEEEDDTACHGVPLDDIDTGREQEETGYHDIESC